MEVQIQSIHFDADQKLLEYVHKKLQKLEKIYERIVSVEVYLKLEEKSSHIKDKTVEIKLHIPQQRLFAKEQSKVFEDAVNASMDSIMRQLKKHKEKLGSKY